MTEQSWVLPYYKLQFELMDSQIEFKMEKELAAQTYEIHEQVGKPFTSMLDIGAGSGMLARAMSKRGTEMTTLELVPELVEYARSISDNSITILCGDFYTIELDQQFDVVSYMDGFGVGDDTDQLHLLKRISGWLKDDSCALIDIYNPVYWRKISGQKMRFDKAEREYGYDVDNERMLDTWWHPEQPENALTQSLRCYTVEEISKLCEKAGLKIEAIFPGGAMDYDEWVYSPLVSLNECLSYRIKVKK